MLDEYVVLDLETTGLSKKRHKITEIAAVKFKGNKVVGEYQTLVNPETSIPSFITKLTGISNDMVKNSPKIHEVLPEFVEFLGEAPIVAHNATFDHGFIAYNMEKHLNCSFVNEKLCTKKLANRLLPDLYSKRLGVICEHLEISNEQAHRAMSDVKATAEVFSKFLEMASEKGIKNEKELFRFERRPRN